MPRPRFSILVPTLNRPETLAHCLRTLVSQPGEDFEILVSDNQSDPSTKGVVDAAGHANRVRYLRTPTRFSVREQFEFCVENSAGQYLTILGDDDGFCVGALASARQVLDQAKPEPDLLFWFPHLYWWPNALIPAKRWMLYVHAAPKAAKWVNAKQLVNEFFAAGASPWLFERLPSIYNGFVAKPLLDRIKQRTGSYFSDEIPDVDSGIANGLMASSAILLERPLSIRGLSGKSYGVAFRSKKAGAKLREEANSLFKSSIHDPELVESSALSICIAAVKLRSMRRFPELSGFRIVIPDVINGILRELNEDRDRYEDLLADARALAAKYQIDFSAFTIPPRAEHVLVKTTGITLEPQGRALIAINGEPIKISDIHLASLCVQSILG